MTFICYVAWEHGGADRAALRGDNIARPRVCVASAIAAPVLARCVLRADIHFGAVAGQNGAVAPACDMVTRRVLSVLSAQAAARASRVYLWLPWAAAEKALGLSKAALFFNAAYRVEGCEMMNIPYHYISRNKRKVCQQTT